MHAVALPALTGKFGQWRYYQVVMQVSTMVENFGTQVAPVYRVKTVEEVEEIYSRQGVSYLLQRAFDVNRLEPFKRYLLSQSDKYLNNITVAIFGGNPDWVSLDIKKIGGDLDLDEEGLENLVQTFGIIKLTGFETLFVLDGQHRLKALRAAIEENPEIGDESVAMTLIIHQDSESGRKRTRRLFSTINRHAKPVSKGENILLDEDDLSAIIARKVIEEYPLFTGKSVVGENKVKNLYPNQYGDKITTVIALYDVNEKLIDNSSIYANKEVRIRPEDDVIESNKEVVFQFWDTYFEIFPLAAEFILGDSSIGLSRNHGGPFYLRPIGQVVFAEIYKKLKELNKLDKLSRILTLDMNIESEFWHHIFWNPTKEAVLASESLVKYYLFYHFGFPQSSATIKTISENYKKNSGDLNKELPASKNLLQ